MPDILLSTNANGVHELTIDGEFWMSDEKQEREIQEALASKSHGRVLVAGLGFGLYQMAALANPKVTSIVTVELYPEMEKIAYSVSPELELHPRHKLIFSDFYKFKTDEKFDTVYGDIWTGDSAFTDEAVWQLWKRIAKKFTKPGGQVIGWHARSLGGGIMAKPNNLK